MRLTLLNLVYFQSLREVPQYLLYRIPLMLVYWWPGHSTFLPILKQHMSQICTSKCGWMYHVMSCDPTVCMSCRVVIPLDFELISTGIIHGLAFWFEIGFIGTRYVTSTLSMSPMMSLLPCIVPQCGYLLLHTNHLLIGIRYDTVAMWPNL